MPNAGKRAPKPRAKAASVAGADRGVKYLKLQLKAGGRVVLPAELRTDLGVSEGDLLHGRLVDGELLVMSRDTAIRKAQDLVRKYVPEGVSLVDELIEERRAEARKESE